jgi:methanogenic corrinoid protein MtbC1
VAGDEAGAWSVLEAALASDKTPTEVLLDLVTPAMRAIGTRWEHGELSIADEHRASAVVVRLVSRLGARFARRGVKRGTVVLAAPAGELHAVPVAIAANLLRWSGFDVVELGANTPAAAMVETVVGQPDLLALGIVCTTDGAVGEVAEAITNVRQASPDTPILLGGAAVAHADQARKLGADVFTGGRADEVVRAVEAIVTGAA